MVVRESGIIISGCPIVYSNYHATLEKEVNIVLKTGLLTGFMMFVENAFDAQSIEYIESGKYIIIFKKDRIKTNSAVEPILAYAIVDREKKTSKSKIRDITKLLSKVLKKFIIENMGKNFASINQFRYFKGFLDKCFNSRSQSSETKVDLFLACTANNNLKDI